MRLTFLIFTLILVSGEVSSQSTLYTFQSALSKTKENNPILRSEQLNLESARFDILGAGLRPNPSLNNQTLIQLDSKYYPPNSEWSSPLNRQVWYQVTKPFQLDNLRAKKIEFSQQGLKVTEKAYFETERNVLNATANQWLSTWYSYLTYNTIEKTLKNIDSLNIINENRFKNQVITKSDLIRMQLLAEQYRLKFTSARQNYFNQLKSLRVQLGVADSIAIDVNDPFVLIQLPNNLDSLISLSLQQRADLQWMQANVALAESNIVLQKSRAYPQPEIGLIWNPQNTVPYLGFFGTIQLPFFARNQSEIGKSKVYRQQSELNKQRTELTLRAEVETSYKTFLLYQSNLSKYQNLLSQSEIVLETVRYAYLRGATNLIDFLEAQRAWFDTRQNYYETLFTYRKSYIDLLFVTGTLNKM